MGKVLQFGKSTHQWIERNITRVTPDRPLFLKILIILFLIFGVAVLTVVYVMYKQLKYIHTEITKEELLSVTTIAAMNVNGDLVERLRDPADEGNAEYRQLQNNLIRTMRKNPRIDDIYLMRKTARADRLAFILNAYRQGENHVRLGETYDLSQAPEMIKGFRGSAVDRDYTTDKWGIMLSGYAPVLNSKGKIVGILAIDYLVKDLWGTFVVYHRVTFWLTIIGLMIVLGIGLLYVRGMINRLKNIQYAIDMLLEEKYNVFANETGNDEINLLALNVNKLIQKCTADKEQLVIHFTKSLVKALEARDPYTSDHSEQVAEITNDIMQEFNLDPERRYTINFAAILHDIGKIGISDLVLNKPDRLNDREYAIIRQHPVIGDQILEGTPEMVEIRNILRHHHERFDGRGYPDGLVGLEINLGARIIAVADSFQAMISDRAYRKGMSQEMALEELIKHSGTQFDPAVVEVFLRICQVKRYKPQANNLVSMV